MHQEEDEVKHARKQSGLVMQKESINLDGPICSNTKVGTKVTNMFSGRYGTSTGWRQKTAPQVTSPTMGA